MAIFVTKSNDLIVNQTRQNPQFKDDDAAYAFVERICKDKPIRCVVIDHIFSQASKAAVMWGYLHKKRIIQRSPQPQEEVSVAS